MPVLLTDQNFNEAVVRGLRRRLPAQDILSIRDFGLGDAPDEDVLKLAAERSSVLLTHDAKTIPPLFYRMLADELEVPFIVLVPWELAIGRAVEELELMLVASTPTDWRSPPRLIRIPQ